MRFLALIAVAVPLCTSAAIAQQSDSTRARAVRDSIALMRELGGALTPPRPATQQNVGTQTGPTNPRLLPDFSAVGDFVGDLSPNGTTQADGTRMSIREVELAVQAVVDPYLRGDFFLGISDLEGISIEQAFLTTTSLPNELELRIGRYLMPFGKQNTTHRHDLHTIEYPYVIQKLLSDDGLKGTGLWLSRVFAPFGFYQELQVTAVDRLSERDENLVSFEDVNKRLSGLGYSARLRNYVDLTESTNFELSFSAITGKREQELIPALQGLALNAGGVPINAINARQTTYGSDLTFRWRPLQQGLYQSFMLQSEVMHQQNDKSANFGPNQDYTGAYVFARYQTGQRTFLGARYDYLQNPENAGRTLNAGSGYLEWFPSEFSKFSVAYEALSNAGSDVVHRVLLQATFALGPHKPHPF